MSLTVKMLSLIDDAVLKFELGHSVFELGLSFGLPESFFLFVLASGGGTFHGGTIFAFEDFPGLRFVAVLKSVFKY